MIDLKINNLTEAIENKMDRSKWITYKFSDLVDNIVEKVVPKNSGLQHYIGLEHLDAGSLKIKRFGVTESLIGDKLKIFKGDLIFAKRNSYLKRVAIADFDAIASAHSMVLRPKTKNVDPKFLPFFMMSEIFWKRAIEISVGSLSPTINWKSLAKQEFLLPPKAEQTRLAALLWAIDEVIEKEKVVLERLNNYFLSKLNSLFWDLRVANQKTKFGSIPIHWQLVRLEEVSKKIGDGIHSTPNYVENSNFRFINGNNINDSKIQFTDRTQFVSEQEFSKYNLKLEKGTILMSINGTIGNLGFYNGEDVILGKSVAYITPTHDKLYNEYLYFLLQTKKIIDFYYRELTGTTISNLSLKSIRNTPVPLPPFDEQILIANSARQLVELLTKGKTKLAFSQSLQKSLINQIF